MDESEKIKFIFEVKYPKDSFESDINTLMYRFRNFVIFQDRMSKGDSNTIIDYKFNNKNIDNMIEILNKFKITIEECNDNGRSNNK